MNKLLILISAGLILACNSEQKDLTELQVESAPNPGSEQDSPRENPNLPRLGDCLVAYYPFTGNANDHSGYNNHGAVDGAFLTHDRHGNENQAYFFDGYNDQIVAPYQSQLDLSPQFTISAWIYPLSLKTQKILTRGSGINPPYSLSLSQTHDIVFSVNPTGETRAEGYETHKWSLLTAVHNNGVMTLYVNGKEVAREVSHPSFLANSNAPLQIGRRLTYNDSFFGRIDEVKIYCRALNSRDVSHLYNSTK